VLGANLTYFNELDRGNHFAAWQEPALFSAELRAAFRPLHAKGAPVPGPRSETPSGRV